MLESIAANTDVIIPPEYMENVKRAIERDGIVLAKVPLEFELEVSRYGSRDAMGMLLFRLKCFPDTSSWRLSEFCLLSVMNRLESRIQLIGEVSQSVTKHATLTENEGPSSQKEDPEVKTGSDNMALARFYVTDTNLFHDLLLTLLRRFFLSWTEVLVCQRP
jgi:hypothetical protein